MAQLACDLAAAGAVGVNLEDGRPDGTLAPVARQRELIGAIKSRVPELFLNARTDTHWIAREEPPPVAGTIARSEAYLAAGADGIFVPGLADDESIRAIVTAIDAPVNVLYLPERHTVPRLADLGVRRVSCGSLLFRTAIHAAVTTALAFAGNETAPHDIPSYAETNDLVNRY